MHRSYRGEKMRELKGWPFEPLHHVEPLGDGPGSGADGLPG